ncbi:hypothetical protein PAHAL_4G254100 [Panicum hallii]|uniref:Uncharacterized protein n=1 Tax=Panicum hallii TaxID=206008 RepID=A0A2T8JDY2_9POAL|nr:hypothetical protein PAHAL_4G254100 [Panicum hallii]
MSAKSFRPAATNPEWLHADRSATNVTASGLTSCCRRFRAPSTMSRNAATASSPRPFMPSPAITVFQQKRFGWQGMVRKTSSARSTLPHLKYMSMRALLSTASTRVPCCRVWRWICRPRAKSPTWVHALTTVAMVTVVGLGLCSSSSCCCC